MLRNIVVSKTVKDLQSEKDRTWRTKGAAHKENFLEPVPCPVCQGFGVVDDETCYYCEGSGEVYE
jgi:DnaJ-class molecular chaperone